MYRAAGYNFEISCRFPRLGCAHNWVLSLHELYLRDPLCNLYAIFQDDIIMCKGVREYIESLSYSTARQQHYLNLYNPPKVEEYRKDFNELGFFASPQSGQGALALVFNRYAVVKLLSSEFIHWRPGSGERGMEGIDGGIVTAMNNVGYHEQVHWPSLVEHSQVVSSTINHGRFPMSTTFPGEEYDATNLIKPSCSEPQFENPFKQLVSLTNLSRGG